MTIKTLSGLFASVILSGILFALTASPEPAYDYFPYYSFVSPGDSSGKKDSLAKDSLNLRYPIQDNPLYGDKPINNLDFEDPPAIRTETYFDTTDGTYKTRQVVGGEEYRPTETKSFDEYLKEVQKNETQDYFRQRSNANSFVRGGGLIPTIKVGPKVFDKIFGGGTIDVRPQGSAELTFGWNYNVVRNPAFTARQQRNGQFDFKQKIQINLTGSIGERLKIAANYDTEATFDFENQMKLNWAGKEDDIIQAVELGNVSLPLNSSLINPGQSLFGLKTKMQFGKVSVTSIFTQQRGQSTSTQVTGGAQVTKFDIQADNYDVNRHFFLSHYFADNYDNWLSNLPTIQSPVIINRIEVWVTNRSKDVSTTRDVVGYMDLGDGSPHNSRWGNSPTARPDNQANALYETVANGPGSQQVRSSFTTVQTLESGTFALDKIEDFQYLSNARLLNANEFTFHRQLGYISLNTALNNDEVLCVAYEYTINGVAYQVGEFAVDVPDDQANPKILNLKLLKGATITTNLPIWDLMMKNVYSLGAFNVQEDKFYLDVVYADDLSGADYTYLPVQNEPIVGTNVLIRTLGLDNINVQGEPTPDGVFDFIPGLTIYPTNGRIVFPVREPFGSYLNNKLTQVNNQEKYVYQELYDSTKWLAQQVVLKNKFFLRGSFQSSTNNEISLNAFNVPQGSVRVTANGTPLTEGTDYLVDYTLGKVTILNTGILESGAVIDVSSENTSMFNVQQKTVVGTRVDYAVNKDLLLGATVMHLWERPLTPKVNIGDEPLLNTIVGFDGAYKTESRWLTKMVDYLPFIETKEISTLTISGEYAQLFPHQPKTIGERGTSFIDDFEGSETPFDMRLGNNWFLASTPEGQPDIFPEGNLLGVAAGAKRAKLAWYTIDPIFQRNMANTQPATPPHLQNNTASSSNHYIRIIQQNEVFPNKQLQNMAPQNLPTLDLAYYPNERGPYNYSPDNLNPNGTFNNPEQNWAGIQRRIETNDFEAANIDYIEMWFMSPWMYNPNIRGTLYLNLGQISEDVLKDRAKSFENGLPTDNSISNQTRTTDVAVVPTGRTLNNAFVNEEAARELQDLGLDGMNDGAERDFYQKYLDTLEQLLDPSAYQQVFLDPSGDNYSYHSSSNFDNQEATVLERYKNYNGQQGNSPLASFQPDGYPVGKTNVPDDEDINQDFSLNTIEEYYQYKVEIDPTKLVIGQNFVADIQVTPVALDNGQTEQVTWYLLRIPISAYDKKVGNIQDFKSIRFMRMYLKDFDTTVVMRFAQFQLVRAEWRRYLKTLAEPVNGVPTTPIDDTKFSTGTVNIEENGFRNPVRYVLPPGFYRVVDPTTPGNVQQNEQSLSLKVCDLKDGDARGVFKTTRLDIRNYKKLQMFVHAEEAAPTVKNGDLQAFIRIGTDLENNYYEYAVPLVITPAGESSPERVWPFENEMNIDLESFYQSKQLRFNQNVPLTQEFTTVLPNGATVRIKGLPDMSNIRVIMLGVRNPLADGNPGDDGLAKCAEVWFNELRMSEFVNQGGWAANGRMVAKLADLGNVTASVNYQSIGFGGLDKKLNDRNLNSTFIYDVSGTFELGKFFPAKWGISVPMYIGRSEQIIKPKYNPLNPDILLTTAMDLAPNEEEKNRIADNAIDKTVRRSINFTNVRKNRVGSSKAHLWDIENFNVSYSYTELNHRNQQIKESLQKTYRASLGYNYTVSQPVKLRPFKKIGKSPWLAILRDFTLTPYPTTLGFRTDVDRFYSRMINRNNDNPNTIVPELYNKNFTMNRFYNMRWDLTSQLRFDFTATNKARIDEPDGKISRGENPDSVQQIIDNFMSLGRNINYQQTLNANYTVPLNKIPILNWISLSGQYTTNYEWKTAPPAASNLGNEIQNSQVYSVTGQFNMVTLYNKIPYFKDVNRGKRSKPKRKSGKEGEEDPKKKGDDEMKGAGPVFARLIMSVKNVSFNYSVTNGLVLPGFTGKTEYFGNDFNTNAPGLPFVFGSQDPNIRFRMAEQGLISNDQNIINQFGQKQSITFSPKATLEPIRDLRIDLTASKNEMRNLTSTFKRDSFDVFRDLGLQEAGSYSITFFSLRTAFDKVDKKGKSATFTQFENNRFTMSRRLALENGINPNNTDTSGYVVGYSRKQHEVLIQSFLAAYAGKDPNAYGLTAFPRIPFPAWNVTYSGLNRIKSLAKIFTNITFRHAYNSQYSVQNFTTPLNQGQGASKSTDYSPRYIIKNITMAEQLKPLLSVDVSFKSGLTTRLEYSRTRTVTLELSSYRVTENRTSEFILGFGYKTKGVRLPFKINRKKPYLKNDLNIRFDFSIRDSKNAVSEIDNVTTIPASGNRIISIKPTIDYSISEKLNLRIFYDRRATQPVVATSFPTAITQGGIQLRYTIQ